MAHERVTVTISSSAGEDTPLTVEDAMRQILDFFALLSAAGGEDQDKVAWRLVSISMNSPLRATAEAFPTVPGIPAEPIARREKEALIRAFIDLEQRQIPEWMDRPARDRARALLARNTEGIARTDVDFYVGENVVSIVPRLARNAIEGIAEAEDQVKPTQEDLSRTEIGSFEAYVIGLTTHYGKPAVEVREKRGDGSVKCPLSAELAERIGQQHRWAEVWNNQRVLVSGRITFRKDGRVGGADVFDIIPVTAVPIGIDAIADPNFTGGLEPETYIRSLWGADIG